MPFASRTIWILQALCLILLTRETKTEKAKGLEDVLKNYETLHHTDITHRRTKRSTDNLEVTEIQMHALGRDFHMLLEKTHDILSPGFKVFSVDKNNKKHPVEDLDINIYKGKLADDEGSSIQAHFESDGGADNLVATIHTKQDTYVVEPSWRHLPQSKNYSMITYKASDMRMQDRLGPSFCGYVRPDGDEAAYRPDNMDEPHAGESATDRYKRQATSPIKPSRNTCSLLLVADYKFYQAMGQNSLSKTTTYLISLIHRIDQIYRKTQFSDYLEMGFGIKEIRVHESWSYVPKGETVHYNMERETWPTKELLEVFSRWDHHLDFCLSHLFTSHYFQDGSLGLSYVASKESYNPGGICSPVYYKDNYELYLNTGWSSTLNAYKRRLLTQEADLVTTHEFGHNWGSEHDPDTTECSPNAFKGGKHIMYTYSVSGYDPNNHIFSPCSRRSMGAVLAAKSTKCFSDRMRAYCGNALVEEGEQCDPGPLSADVDGDACCTKDCKLKSTAQCSDNNDICCTNCQFSRRETLCHAAQNESCEASSYCNGASKTCPAPPFKADGSDCLGRGKCKQGVCQSYCESIGKMSCACDTVVNACHWCCRDDSNSTCMAQRNADGSLSNLPEGMPCVVGNCNNKGECVKQVQDLVQRLWDIIEQLHPSKIGAFMKANIVGTVIILSLFLWIPVSCVVWRIDKQTDKKYQEAEDFRRSANFVMKPTSIRQSSEIHHRNPENMTAPPRTATPKYPFTHGQPQYPSSRVGNVPNYATSTRV